MRSFLTVILFVFACAVLQAQSSINRQIRILDARTRETARLYEEQLGKINGRMISVNENFSAVNKRLSDIQATVNRLVMENNKLKKEINGLKGELDAEKKARQQSLDKMADHVAKETARLVSASRRNTSDTGNGPSGGGNFYEYKIQAGATLSTIAKAYKVSVEDIKKANNLKSDIIRVGQKLYIPKK